MQALYEGEKPNAQLDMWYTPVVQFFRVQGGRIRSSRPAWAT